MKQSKDKKSRFPVFAERFRELRGDMSDTEFSNKLGISRQTIGFYCNGDRIPDAITLRQIAEECQVSTDWIVGLSNIRSSDCHVIDICKFTGLSEQAAGQLVFSKRYFEGEHRTSMLTDAVNMLLESSESCIFLSEVSTMKEVQDELREKANNLVSGLSPTDYSLDNLELEEKRFLLIEAFTKMLDHTFPSIDWKSYKNLIDRRDGASEEM